MAGKGPPPKDPDKRRGKDRTFATTELGPAPPKAPALPKVVYYENGRKKHREHRPETIKWYKAWCKSPMVSQFTDVEWERLHMLAPLVDGIHNAFSENELGAAQRLLSELRLQEAELGATPASRLRLRWKTPDDAGGTSKPPEREAARARPDPRQGLKLVDGGKGA